MRSKDLAELISAGHSNVHFLTLYLLHFPKIYPTPNVILPKGPAEIAYEP
jgi:hypothetical protein